MFSAAIICWYYICSFRCAVLINSDLSSLRSFGFAVHEHRGCFKYWLPKIEDSVYQRTDFSASECAWDSGRFNIFPFRCAILINSDLSSLRSFGFLVHEHRGCVKYRLPKIRDSVYQRSNFSASEYAWGSGRFTWYQSCRLRNNLGSVLRLNQR